MSAYDFRRHAPALPEGMSWRMVDIAVARWVMAHGGDAVLARWAAQASLASGQGDSLLRLPAEVLHHVASSPLVQVEGDVSPAHDTPFVLEGDAFYLRRNHRHEVALGRALQQRLSSNDTASVLSPADLAELNDGDDEAAHPQHEAVAAALQGRMFVLTGGPGTGKTHTVLRMLMAFHRAFVTREGRVPRLALVAPTGKAAARLAESLRMAEAQSFAPTWQDTLKAVQTIEPMTVHRLLGAVPGQGFRRHAGQPLEVDLAAVDEASMLDLALMRALVDALPDAAPLWLIGDADQLDAVGTGSVLQDIVGSMQDSPALVRLQHSFRADPVLQPINLAVQSGRMRDWQQAMASASGYAQCSPARDAAQLQQRIEDWCAALSRLHAEFDIEQALAMDDVAAVQQKLQVLRARQLLCALREGAWGAVGLAQAVDARMAARAGFAADDWYPGKRVMIARNDAASGLFNGDVGLCLPHADGQLHIWFAPASGNDAPRAFATGQLPAWESAAAITVHKAQGSEYAHVGIVLPPDAQHPMLSRQWLYTAVSRARRSLEIWGGEAAIAHALTHRALRQGKLAERIRSG